MNYVTFLPARGVGTAVPEPSWKAFAGLEAHAANKTALYFVGRCYTGPKYSVCTAYIAMHM